MLHKYCSYEGISCTAGRVVTLFIPEMILNGTLPESIGKLAGLYELRLQRNRISGPIPASIGNLKKMKDLNFEANKLYGEIPLKVTELCEGKNIICDFTGNKKLCGEGKRVIGYSCSLCPSEENCDKNGMCNNNFDPSNYFCAECLPEHFEAGAQCLKCAGDWFGAILPPLISLLLPVLVYFLIRVMKRFHLIDQQRFNSIQIRSTDAQTRLKQITTLLQVLSEASRFSNFDYPYWFSNFAVLSNFLTVLFQPQPTCIKGFQLPNFAPAKGLFFLFLAEFFVQFFSRLHSIPGLRNRVSLKMQERCQVLASMLTIITILPIMQILLNGSKIVSRIFSEVLETIEANDLLIKELILKITIKTARELAISITSAIAISFYMYFRVVTAARQYAIERRKYMENPEEYASDRVSQLKARLPFVASFCANYTPSSLFHESKATSRKILCFLIPVLASLIEVGVIGLKYATARYLGKDADNEDEENQADQVEHFFTDYLNTLPLRTFSDNSPLIVACLQALLFQAVHFNYLRHLSKRPYVSFRVSTVSLLLYTIFKSMRNRIVCRRHR